VIISSPNDFKKAARRKLPRFLFDYLDGGAGEEVTVRRNLSDLSSIALRQRVLTEVSEVHLGVELFGPPSHSEPMELSYRIMAAGNSTGRNRPPAHCRS
jgi:isopentenyl diphosphate isomerase/L-lactate dehydrogenase-like FMN-dependent dehydrogenase